MSVSKQDDPSIGEVIQYVREYAEQETIGPLKGAGRWLGYGAAGAFVLGLGLLIMLLGVLRLFQFEFDRLATGAWSWAAYGLVLLITVGLLGLVLQRIKKSTLSNEPK